MDTAPVTELGSLELVKTIKNIYLAEAKGNMWQYIYYINHKIKPMDDVRVRRALAHALNIEGICKRIGPLVRGFPSAFPPAIFGATDEFWSYEYNLDKARQLLTEAGYPEGFELRLMYKRGKLYEPIALEVKNALSKVVDVKLELTEGAVFRKKLKTYKHHLVGWGLSRLVPYLYAQAYLTGAPQNYNQYSNTKVDEVIKKASNARTEEEAKKYWRELQRLTAEDVVTLVPAVARSIQAINKKVKGIVLMPFLGLMDFEKAYIE